MVRCGVVWWGLGVDQRDAAVAHLVGVDRVVGAEDGNAVIAGRKRLEELTEGTLVVDLRVVVGA